MGPERAFLLTAALLTIGCPMRDPARGGPPIHEGQSPLPPFAGVSRATDRYVGVEACSECHPSVAEYWRSTAHAHAHATLVAESSSFDPSCLRCHVTGLGHPGGLPENPAPGLFAVGCESCHGPGSGHVAAPRAGYGRLPRRDEACTACHTVDTSPDFSWAEYWPRVAHSAR